MNRLWEIGDSKKVLFPGKSVFIFLLAETRAKGTLMEYALVVEPLNLYLQLVFILFLL